MGGVVVGAVAVGSVLGVVLFGMCWVVVLSGVLVLWCWCSCGL